jgi:hypothetical protein
MGTSVHVATARRLAALRHVRRGVRADGLVYSEACTLAPLSPHVLPHPSLRRIGLIAAWRDDAALDAFRATDETFAQGAFARLEPVRAYGEWPELGELPDGRAADTSAPVAVLTLGRLRPTRLVPFLRASAGAEGAVLSSPAAVFATGLARPPRLVATFSIWDDIETMRAVVSGDGHGTAMAAHAAKPFHSASAFIRYRIREQDGSWT